PQAQDAPAYAGTTLAATPRQRDLLAQSLTPTGAGHHVEQLHWTWHGPLDGERFTAAWQAGCDSETLLRAAFDPRHPTPIPRPPRLTPHDRPTGQLVRPPPPATPWTPRLDPGRRRGPYRPRPAALRVTVLDTAPSPRSPTEQQARILLTFHQALIDTFSARV